MGSFTYSASSTFTITHAKELASKVSADLKRMQRFYGAPSDADIASYEIEVIELLKAGYLGSLTVGFKKDEQWIEPTLRYTAKDLAGMAGTNDDPGRVRPGSDVSGAKFHNYLTKSAKWYQATTSEQEAFEARMPFQRKGMAEPTIKGYLEVDRTYTSGGKLLERSAVRSY